MQNSDPACRERWRRKRRDVHQRFAHKVPSALCILHSELQMSVFETHMESIAAGVSLSADDIRELAATPDILPLGMLADTLRRRLHGVRATFLRVAACRFDQSFSDGVPPSAREIRILGAPDALDIAVTAVTTAKDVAGSRTVAAFAWADIDRWAAGGRHAHVLETLRTAGLDAVAELPIDTIADLPNAIRRLRSAGFDGLRLSVSRVPAADRTQLLLGAADLQKEFGGIQSLDPLPAADRKSTRLNSSHGYISYAVFCWKKKTRLPMTGLTSI